MKPLDKSAAEMTEVCARCGIRITQLSEYYADKRGGEGMLVVNYGGADEDMLTALLTK
ncbi:MAG: hypothetical protein K2N38_14345 [Oscillospiraceae bacterium]|nr:hypothetical protein [Oscillospiraceae bacterium]